MNGWAPGLIPHSAVINMGVQLSAFYVYLHSFGYLPKSAVVRSHGTSIFSSLRNLHADIQSGCTHTFPPTVYKGSFFSTFSPTFVIVCFFDDSYSAWGEEESRCHFDLPKCGLIFGTQIFMGFRVTFFRPQGSGTEPDCLSSCGGDPVFRPIQATVWHF
jgi:hypothetical protein